VSAILHICDEYATCRVVESCFDQGVSVITRERAEERDNARLFLRSRSQSSTEVMVQISTEDVIVTVIGKEATEHKHRALEGPLLAQQGFCRSEAWISHPMAVQSIALLFGHSTP